MNEICQCTGIPAGKGWKVWCGGFAARPYPPIPSEDEKLLKLLNKTTSLINQSPGTDKHSLVIAVDKSTILDTIKADAEVAELADALRSGRSELWLMRVQIPPSALPPWFTWGVCISPNDILKNGTIIVTK